ncbi:hypothetical protein Y032_0030g2234 [Ancylostoma ceylanicum]|nr:hypothetical protein Y032_0030g2234 [Ancylostoma ceylanicum]
MKSSSQGVTDLCVFLISIHGSMGILGMLLSNKYYRSEILQICGKLKCIKGIYFTNGVNCEETSKSDTKDGLVLTKR